MTTLKQLEKDVKQIKARNKRVEANKAWETSWARRIVIVLMTYIVIVIFFTVADLPDPWVNSIVPATAFVLSTLSLPFFKRFWIRSSKK